LITAFATTLSPARARESFAAWTWEREFSWESLKWYSTRPFLIEDLGPDGDGLSDFIIFDVLEEELCIWRQTAKGFVDEPEILAFPDTVTVWDFGEVDGKAGSEIVFLNDSGEAMALSPGSEGSEPTLLIPSRSGAVLETGTLTIHRTEFLLDLDGNGLVDIVVPAEFGLQWHMQTAPGEFRKGSLFPVDLERSNSSHSSTGISRLAALSSLQKDCVAGEAFGPGYGFRGERWLGLPPSSPPFSFRYKSSLISAGEGYRLADLNGAGRLDIQAPRKALQGADGSFDFESFEPLSPVEALELPEGQNNGLNIDINGDGNLDSFTINQVSRSMQNPKTKITAQIMDSDGVTEIMSKTQTLSLYPWSGPLADLNGDGALDFFGAKVDFQMASAQSQLKAFFGKGIDAELRVHLWRKDEGYSPKPDIRRKLKVVGDHRILMIVPDMDYTHDFTGDGFPDILVRTKPRQLSLIPYEPKKKRYAKQPKGVLDLPGTLDRIYSFPDLNNDGKSDLILALSADDNYSNVRYLVALTK